MRMKMVVTVVMAVLLLSISVVSVVAADSTHHYGMVVFLKGSEFFNWAYGGMQDAANALGIDIDVELRGPATWDASEEARAIEQLIARGIDGILVTAGDAVALNPAIDKAIAKGIPVITFDSDAPASNRLCFVGTDNYQAGYAAGKAMVEWLNGDGEVGISTFPGPEHLVQRINGFKAALEGSNVTVVATGNDEGEVAKAESAITAMLQAHPEIDAVFCAHGNPGPGAVAAVKNVGREGQIQIMGFDFGMPVVEGIEKGEIRATVGQNPYLMGYLGMMMLWSANQEARVAGSNPPFGYYAPTGINTGVNILYKDDIGMYLTPPAFVSGGE